MSPRLLELLGLAAGLFGMIASGAASAPLRIEGHVQAGGGAVANSTVTLWAGGAGAPKQLAQGKTGNDGGFALGIDETPGPGESLYVTANGGVAAVNKGDGDNPALAFLSVLGSNPPANVVDQRDDDSGVGLDERPVPRRRGDQGSSAEPAHRRGQRAQFR